MSKYTWFGTDASNECSLFDNGFLMRRKGCMYEVYVQYGLHEYVYGLFDDEEFISDMEKNYKNHKVEYPRWDHLASMVGMTAEEYRNEALSRDRDSRAMSILSDALMYYATDDVVGISAWASPYTESEMRRTLNKALSA